ncbi:MAG: hypothetical protein JSW35_10190 [Deltaproteobacteria bacterium]|nr:MAG: hypothetical protein JSW35_10190 [Deltaproteobacteria bacterium]
MYLTYRRYGDLKLIGELYETGVGLATVAVPREHHGPAYEVARYLKRILSPGQTFGLESYGKELV